MSNTGLLMKVLNSYEGKIKGYNIIHHLHTKARHQPIVGF